LAEDEGWLGEADGDLSGMTEEKSQDVMLEGGTKAKAQGKGSSRDVQASLDRSMR